MRRPTTESFAAVLHAARGKSGVRPISTMRRVRANFNPTLDIEGVLLTMYDERTNLGQLVARDVREFFREKVFNTIIPRNVKLGEAPSHGIPGVIYDSKSRGAAAYVALAQELLSRNAA